jgi:hypothetical protein
MDSEKEEMMKMNKTVRNLWYAIFLYALLGINLVTSINLLLNPDVAFPAPALVLHIISGTLLAAGCLLHVWWHRVCFQTAFRPKGANRTALIMNSIIMILLLIAAISGFTSLDRTTGGGPHDAIGIIALIGLLIHAIRHISWMTRVTKKPLKKVSQSQAKEFQG